MRIADWVMLQCLAALAPLIVKGRRVEMRQRILGVGVESRGGLSGSFNLGLQGFEFTDMNQTDRSIAFAGSTGGFPCHSLGVASVSANTIRIFMNEPTIPRGDGTVWTATWTSLRFPNTGAPH